MRIGIVLILLAAAAAARAADGADSTRVLRTFDFEERRLGNVEDLPMDWGKVEGTGLPHYISAHLSSERHRSGQYSFQFDLDGGSLIYRLPFGHIPVQTGAHYNVQGYVQTTYLPNARARITSYLSDAIGHPIVSSVRQSELFASLPGDPQWHLMSVELSADDPAAAFLVIELSLLQPQMYAQATLGKQTVFEQDIHGSAWFDDVSISQVPVVAMTTDRPGNIFRKRDPMRIHVAVNDRFTDDLSTRLLLKDATGRVLYQNTTAVDLATARQSGPGQKSLTVDLPTELSAGWYQASLEISSRGTYIGRQRLNMIRLADDAAPTIPDARFGVTATHLPFAAWSQLPGLLPSIGSGRVKLAVWSSRSDAGFGDEAAMAGVDAAEFDRVLDQLQQIQVKPTACLIGLPPAVTARMRNGSWTQVLDGDRSAWQPALAFLVARNANHLSQWQLGDDGTDVFVQDPRMRDVYATIYHEFASLVEKPDLAMPWPAWYELTGEANNVALHVKPQIVPSQIPLYVDDIRSAQRPTSGAHQGLSLFLEPLDRRAFGRDVQIRDMAERFAYATSADVQRIDLRLPFDVQRVADQWIGQPDELLLIARTLMTTL
ncbi:MAG: hypothetical protein JO353_00820, partial [Phycisphaerae bacterium]|nr:hypothetical protein [Phycisphaerae bacterium]